MSADIKLTSAHLKALRDARLVTSRREGKFAYCRGPFCLLSDEAVALLAAKGYRVRKILDGVSEWQAAGLPVQASNGEASQPRAGFTHREPVRKNFNPLKSSIKTGAK